MGMERPQPLESTCGSVGGGAEGRVWGAGRWRVSDRWQARELSVLTAWASCPALPRDPARRGRARPVLWHSDSELGQRSGQQSPAQGPGCGAVQGVEEAWPLVAPVVRAVEPCVNTPWAGPSGPSPGPRSLSKAHSRASVPGVRRPELPLSPCPHGRLPRVQASSVASTSQRPAGAGAALFCVLHILALPPSSPPGQALCCRPSTGQF